MKNITLICLMLFFTLSNSFGQEWLPFNDSLVYYYSASNTGEYYTLRIRSKTVSGDETKIHFTDNYIPCDDTAHPDGYQLYYAQNGSILGDSMLVVNDTIWLDNNIQFVNTMTLGETLPFSALEGSEITFVSAADTLLFDIPDSVKYYAISDGTQLIQSKNFGILLYPKQNSDSLIYYELVGIENSVGLNFDHHNEIFDFEVGDKFFYYNSFYSVFYDIWDGDYSTMVILDKYEIEGKYYYDVSIDGSFISNYPMTAIGNPSFDHPGEITNYCRACDGINSLPFPYVIDDNNEYYISIGHGYTISPETGNVLHVVGYGDVKDSYMTFETGGKVASNTSKEYSPYPYDENEFLIRTYNNAYGVIYEEGYGMVYFDGNTFEMGHFRKLTGAIKSGVAIGVFAGQMESEINHFNVFPNPALNFVRFDEEISSLGVFDISGRRVLYIENLVDQIEIGQLESGTYMIIGANQKGDIKSARFVKR